MPTSREHCTFHGLGVGFFFFCSLLIGCPFFALLIVQGSDLFFSQLVQGSDGVEGTENVFHLADKKPRTTSIYKDTNLLWPAKVIKPQITLPPECTSPWLCFKPLMILDIDFFFVILFRFQ